MSAVPRDGGTAVRGAAYGSLAMSSRTAAVLISHCICRNRSFADLLPLARRHSWTLTDLIRETGCGGQCGLCKPYLRRMLATGETEFHEIITEDPS